MKALETVEKVKALIEPELEKHGLELVDVEYRREAVGMMLRVFIDRPTGVDLDVCAEASGYVSEVLDKADIINSSYTLEVSSPGIERKLTKPDHYRRFTGRKVTVQAKEPINGRRKFTGLLVAADEQGFSVELDGETARFKYDQVAKTNIVFTDW